MVTWTIVKNLNEIAPGVSSSHKKHITAAVDTLVNQYCPSINKGLISLYVATSAKYTHNVFAAQ